MTTCSESPFLGTAFIFTCAHYLFEVALQQAVRYVVLSLYVEVVRIDEYSVWMTRLTWSGAEAAWPTRGSFDAGCARCEVVRAVLCT